MKIKPVKYKKYFLLSYSEEDNEIKEIQLYGDNEYEEVFDEMARQGQFDDFVSGDDKIKVCGNVFDKDTLMIKLLTDTDKRCFMIDEMDSMLDNLNSHLRQGISTIESIEKE